MRVKIKINPKFEALTPLVERVAAEGMPPGAEIIYDERNRLFAIPSAAGDVVVKSFHIPSAVNAVVYSTLRRSKARRSFEHAMRLIELGFHTPEPVAYIERREGLKLRESYYICLRLSDCETMRYWSRKPDLPGLLDAFAAEILKLHQRGVLNQDFSPGNILVTGDSASGYTFHYVDLNRMKFNVFDHRRLMANFRCITLDRGEMEDLAERFARVSGLGRDTVMAEAARHFDAYRDLQRRKRRVKSLLGRNR